MRYGKTDRKRFLYGSAARSLVVPLLFLAAILLLGLAGWAYLCPGRAGEKFLVMLQNFISGRTPGERARLLGQTLARTASLCLCALAIALPCRAGMYNLGVAGQYALGAGAALVCALEFRLPWAVCVLAAAALGAVWGALCGALKGGRNVSEALSGLLMNAVALVLCRNKLRSLLSGGGTLGVLSTGPMLPTLGLDGLFGGEPTVTPAIPAAALAAAAVYIVLERTRAGAAVKAAALNAQAPMYPDPGAGRTALMTLTAAGALAGLGAAAQLLSGAGGWSLSRQPAVGMVCAAAAAALLGGMDPFGTLLWAFVLQHLSDGAALADGRGPLLTEAIYAVLVGLGAFAFFIRHAGKKRKEKGGEKP